MSEQEIIEQAKKDYKEIKDIVKGMTFDNAYEYFNLNCGGVMNYDKKLKELFDVNYGAICFTILNNNGVAKLDNGVEIWDDENCRQLCLDYRMEV